MNEIKRLQQLAGILNEIKINKPNTWKGNFINSILRFNDTKDHYSKKLLLRYTSNRLSSLTNGDVAEIMSLYDGIEYENNSTELNNRFNKLFNTNKNQIKQTLEKRGDTY